MHDLIGTDRRKPTVNTNGKFYGAPENSTDYWPVLDPLTHTATEVKNPVRDPNTPSHRTDPMAPSPYWGPDPIWDSQTSTHSFAMDGQGRVWAASRIRQNQTMPWCQAGSDHPSAKAFPLTQSGRQIEMYDPKTKQTTPIDTCFSSGHVNLDKNDILPKWLAYMSIWMIVTELLASPVFIFKSGPLAWNGSISFYVGTAVFVVWEFAIIRLLYVAIKNQSPAEQIQD